MTGIVCFDKPEGITSFTAVKKVSRLFGIKKAGHAGTLDPLATGVMVILLSGCTRFIELLPDHSKSYEARVRLGITTDTLDIMGKVLSQVTPNVTEQDIMSVLDGFRGDILQTPPMFSAIKKNGERLYDLARQGVEVEREPRKVTVSRLEMSNFDGDSFTLSVDCSSGTYIRSLCDDIGKRLGCGACMEALRRTKANGFGIEKAYTLSQLEALGGDIYSAVIPLDEALAVYPKITVTAPQAKRFANGGSLFADRLNFAKQNGGSLYRVYSPDGKFLGIGELMGENLNVKRVLSANE